MSPKVEKQLAKIKALDAQILVKLEAGRVEREKEMAAKEAHTKLYNEVNLIEAELEAEKKKLFEYLRNEK